MRVICDQNKVGLAHKNDPIIAGWMHGDEPDNAQSLPGGKGYGPPIPPAKIVAGYKKIRAADPTRPVLLNLGQGVAWDGWYGRGVRTNHPEDYPEYVKGCDIASFDIYPVAHDAENPRDREVKGNLDFVAKGVERLVKWTREAPPSGSPRLAWNCIECTCISSAEKATPKQVKAEVWMSIIRGSRGIVYFVHQFKPKFVEPALLEDPEMLEAVTAINKQIQSLAAVLNGPAVEGIATVSSDNTKVPIALAARRSGDAIYLFAVPLKAGSTKATFALSGPAAGAAPAATTVEVLGENRKIPMRAGQFQDSFRDWDVHLYRIGPAPR